MPLVSDPGILQMSPYSADKQYQQDEISKELFSLFKSLEFQFPSIYVWKLYPEIYLSELVDILLSNYQIISKEFSPHKTNYFLLILKLGIFILPYLI